MKRTINVNKYDLCLYTIIISLSFGQYGGSFQITRILAVLLMPFVLSLGRILDGGVKQFSFIYSLFLTYCVFSLLWTSDILLGVKEIIYYIIIGILVAEFLLFSKLSKHPINTISNAWVVSFLLTSVIAIWEISTGNHLSISYTEEGKVLRNGIDEALVLQFASATFGNYNAYVVFICFSLPFIFFKLGSKKWKLKFAGIFSLMVAIWILFMNASRGGILTLLVVFVIYLYYLLRRVHHRILYICSIMFILGSFLVVFGEFILNNLFNSLLYRISSGGMLEDTGRVEIWSKALYLSAQNYFLGTGVGSMLASMSLVRSGENPMTHNLFIEIFLQYGAIFLLLFLCFLFKIYKNSIRLEYIPLRSLCISACLSMPFTFVINSNYLTMSSLWIYLFSLYIISKEKIFKERFIN